MHFSWDTVMPFFHADNTTGPYSDEAIRSIARFPLVTLEKWHGACGDFQSTNKSGRCPDISLETYPCCEEQTITSDLRRVKAISPNTTRVVYFNMVLDFPQYKLVRCRCFQCSSLSCPCVLRRPLLPV